MKSIQTLFSPVFYHNLWYFNPGLCWKVSVLPKTFCSSLIHYLFQPHPSLTFAPPECLSVICVHISSYEGGKGGWGRNWTGVHILGPVVRRPISANPGLNFNLGFYFSLFKSCLRIIFSIYFQNIRSTNWRQKDLSWIFSSSFQILNQILY